MYNVGMVLLSAVPMLIMFAVGVLVGRVWAALRTTDAPRPNPWEVRPSREWDGGEHWTQSGTEGRGSRHG